jgi:hypothetical protein
MIKLLPPLAPAYDYPSLAYFVNLWRSSEEGEPWLGVGFGSCAASHRQAVSSRMWDTSTSLLDDELESNTSRLMGLCIEALDGVDRALVMCGQCGVTSRWVSAMDPLRAQQHYEDALGRLAVIARKEGVDV